MSTDCEGILRRFLVLNPTKRCSLEVRKQQQVSDMLSRSVKTFNLSKDNKTTQDQCVFVKIQFLFILCLLFFFLTLHSFILFCPQQIMRDKWINSGYDGKELKPFSEPVEDLNDTSRIGRNKPLFN